MGSETYISTIASTNDETTVEDKLHVASTGRSVIGVSNEVQVKRFAY